MAGRARATTKPLRARTLSVTIQAKPGAVYAFVFDPRNLPKWAKAFCLSVRKTGGRWIVTSPQGPVAIRFVKKNAFGVLDHVVSPAPGVSINVPMRVVANGPGSEVVFTLYRMPGMSAGEFARDIGWVRRDLDRLRAILERKESK